MLFRTLEFYLMPYNNGNVDGFNKDQPLAFEKLNKTNTKTRTRFMKILNSS